LTYDALCRQIAEEVGRSFLCETVGGYIQIRTPFVYPDGQVIDLYVKSGNANWMATDLGETHRWLDSQSWADKRTPAQQDMIQQILKIHGVETFNGALLASFGAEQGVGDAITRLAQAAARVSDIWFTFRVRSTLTMREEVAELLGEKGVKFDRRVEKIGKSESRWFIDFETRTSDRTSLVQVLTTGNRGAAGGIRDRVLTSWFDLGGSDPSMENGESMISLFDDTLDVWKDEDYRLLEGVSKVAYWSHPEEFVSYLGTPI